MKRTRSLWSRINSTIGSATHWALRGLISFLSEKVGIKLPTWLERNIAYYATGLLLVAIGVWHYLPWLPSVQFSPLNIDWSFVLTIVSLVIVVVQTVIIYRQLEIMEKQDELLARRSKLEMTGNYNRAQQQFEFDVTNKGTKGADDFYWDIHVPAVISDGRLMKVTTAPPSASLDSRVLGGVLYNRYSGFRDDKLYPDRTKFLCSFPLPSINTKEAFRFYWQLIGEDGVFPAKDHYGSFELTTNDDKI